MPCQLFKDSASLLRVSFGSDREAASWKPNRGCAIASGQRRFADTGPANPHDGLTHFMRNSSERDHLGWFPPQEGCSRIVSAYQLDRSYSRIQSRSCLLAFLCCRNTRSTANGTLGQCRQRHGGASNVALFQDGVSMSDSPWNQQLRTSASSNPQIRVKARVCSSATS
jgi:hypothetical protein